jgi:hypothetical protein
VLRGGLVKLLSIHFLYQKQGQIFMFNNPSKIDSTYDEGTVSEVDPIRFFCKVKTIRGQNLNQVQWLQNSGGSNRGGDRATPTMGDRVMLNNALGYPVIIGYLPKLQTSDNAFPVNIDTGEQAADTGNFSSAGVNAINDQNKAGDMAVGDRIIASNGGGMLAVLRGGSLLLRSSRLAEIFISKWDDVVRIVSRNFEHFTDVSSDIVKNIKGRVYRYTGYAATDSAARSETYMYNLYYGDTALAEAVKTDYQNITTAPAASTIIFKEEVPAMMYRTVDGVSGEVFQVVGQTTIHQTATAVTVDFGGNHIATWDGSQITLSYENAQIVTLTGSVIDLKHSSGAEVLLDNTGVSSTFNGHYIKVTSGGVQMG